MKIIFTGGDINGIGIEILLKALAIYESSIHYDETVKFYLAANTKTLIDYINQAGLNFEIHNNTIAIGKINLFIKEINSNAKIDFGKVSQASGLAAAESFDLAISGCLNGDYDAMVTMPVCKEALYMANWKFPGHTEALAAKCKVTKPLMILFKDKVRCGLVTIHTPLKDIPYELSFRALVDICATLNESLKIDFGIKEPKIAVLGLNPHSGENGTIGDEERTIIAPAIAKLNARKINAIGPFPADGFFAHGDYLNYDAYLAMYHDQGLIPLKLLAQSGGVNFTAGLPIVRTSPDHGTAFNLAGKNIANPTSAYDSIIAAIEIVKNRKNK